MIVRGVGGGVEVKIRASPRAHRTELAGPYGGRAVRIRIAAPPADGAANEELLSFLSELFDVPARAVSIVRGAGSRDKVIHVKGIEASCARRTLDL